MKAFVTRKIGMTSTIAEDGTVQAVTLLSIVPALLRRSKPIKQMATAVQVGF